MSDDLLMEVFFPSNKGIPMPKHRPQPAVIRCTIEPTGKFFFADARQYETDEVPWYLIHNGTLSQNTISRTIAYNTRPEVRHPDVNRYPLFVFEARNRTQVNEELRSRGFVTNFQSIKKGSPDMNAIERRKRQAEAAIERAQAELDRLYRLPDEPVVEDDAPNVIYFQKRFSPNSRLYDYAAIKASDGLWYTTGPQSPKGYTWDRLVEWMFDGHEDLTIYTTKKFRPLS